MVNKEVNAQDIGQESSSVAEEFRRPPQENVATQYWLQNGLLEPSKPLDAVSKDDLRSLQRFTSSEQRLGHPAYQLTSQISKEDRIREWGKRAPGVNLEGRRDIWDEAMEDYFKSNEDFFASPEGTSAKEFLIRFGFDPLAFTKDTSHTLFDCYFTKDSADSRIGKFIEDVLSAEGLMHTGLEATDFDLIRGDREIIWTLAHIFGDRSSAIITHLLDSEVTIIKIAEGVESIDGFLQKLRAETMKHDADKTVQPAPVDQEKPKAVNEVVVDEAARHREGLKNAGIPDWMPVEEADQVIKKFNEINGDEEAVPDDYPIGDTKGAWLVQALRKLGFEVETQDDIDAGVTRITKFKRPRTAVIINEKQSAPVKKTLKGVPPFAPVVFEDIPQTEELRVDSKIEDSVGASAVSQPPAERRTNERAKPEYVLLEASEDPLAKIDAIYAKLIDPESKYHAYVFMPRTELDSHAMSIGGLIQDELREKRGLSATEVLFGRGHRMDIKGGRAVIIEFINKNPQRVSLHK